VTEEKRACCSSPAGMCYWFAVSLIAWGALSLIGIYRHPLHGSSATAILFAMGIGCVANWVRNRTLHCAFTAPLFLIAAVVSLLCDVNILHVNAILIWPFVLIGVGAAFLAEWRYSGVVRQGPRGGTSF
jgi:hypothetical protein